MTLKLYSFIGDNKLSDKSNNITLIETLEGNLKENTSFQTPSILIKLGEYEYITDGTNYVYGANSKLIYYYDQFDTIITANYCYITEFNRYYYIVDRQISVTGLLRLDLREDVLFTYDSSIRALSGLVARNENSYDVYLKDDLVNFEYDKTITYQVPANLSTVTSFSTTIIQNNVVISYLTDSTVYYSSSTPTLPGLTTINTYSSGANITTQYLLASTGAVYDLAKAVYKHDTLLSYIKNIMVYPYELSNASDNSVTTIKIGNTDYALTDTFKYPLYYPDRITHAHFKMDSATSFLDYSPYTRYYFYLPYYGEVEMSAENILGKVIYIFYLVNYEDSTATVNVYNSTNSKMLFTGQCSLGVKIALSSTNALEIQNQKTALNLNTAINLVGSVLSVAGGIYSGNGVAVAGGLLSGAKAIGSGISTFNQLYDLGNVAINSGLGGLSNIQQFYIRTVKAVPKNYDSDYASLYGLPLNQYTSLSNLSGFTVLSDIQLSNGFEGASETEKNEILSLLKSGIIL